MTAFLNFLKSNGVSKMFGSKIWICQLWAVTLLTLGFTGVCSISSEDKLLLVSLIGGGYLIEGARDMIRSKLEVKKEEAKT